MSPIQICDELFDGPVTIEAPGVDAEKPGVFVIVCECEADGLHRLVACGETRTLGDVFADAENQHNWRGAYPGRLRAYIWQASEADQANTRKSLVEKICERYHPWCNRPQGRT